MGVGSLIRLASRERERERELSSAPTQDYIILQPTKPKSKAKVVFLVLGAILLLVGSVVAGVLILNHSNGGDNGATNRAVLKLLDESHSDITRIQSFMIKAKTGGSQMCMASSCFSEGSRANMEDFLTKVQNFSYALDEINPNLISDDVIREKFVSLMDAIGDDLPVYTKLAELYNLFYDYVNSGYGDMYSSEILGYSDDKITKILNALNKIPIEDRSEYFWPVIHELFSVVLGEDYPKVYYYELMGEIEGGLEYEEKQNI